MNEVLAPIGFGLAASVATLTGGGLALRFNQRLTLILGAAAGVVLGVAFFDLIPEALEMSAGYHSYRAVLACVALGFAAYMLLDRALGSARADGERWRKHLGPASLTLHSFLDGMGIGLAFQISPDIGLVVAVAVLTHDLADGINTVSLSLIASDEHLAARWLLINGAAPGVGVIAGLTTRLPPSVLGLVLAVFAGVFLFIGACELVPQSLRRDSRLRVTVASIAGIVLMLLVTAWAK